MTDATRTSHADSNTNLEIRHLVKQYVNAETPVLNDISLTVPSGKVYVVLGPSGSGKSTLLRTVAGLEPIQGGSILLDGQTIAEGDPEVTKASDAVARANRHADASSAQTDATELYALAKAAAKRSSDTRQRQQRSSDLRTRVGMVFQSYDLFPNKTVLGNITLAPTLVQKRPKAEAEQEALELLDRVGLADRKDAWPHELSGGQRQRVAICRALILHPEIMLFDEVTAALDPEMVREVLDVIVELADQGLTMMIVTHEMAFARAIADHIVLLDGGHIVEESDNAEQFFTNPTTERARQFLQTFEFKRHG